jgi:serine/threonine-protein kinase
MSNDNRIRKRPSTETNPQKGPATTPASALLGQDLVGETIGDFHVLRLLGQGGMGTVYLAEQIALKRKVAIKVLRDDIAANPTSLVRFQKESKNVAQLSHANIVQVHTVGEHEGRHYMVLEYVEGKSLSEYLLRKGPLEVPLVLSIMRQVASALQRASEMGIVHRDIKPENILLNRKGETKVADFGLSRCLDDEPANLTRAGSAVGTPVYMSPEQVEGKPVDHRSDIYSFGVTCYHMLAGKVPFAGSNAYQIAIKHVREEPRPLEKKRSDLPPGLVAIVNKMLAKKPRDRYQSARELLEDLSRLRKSLNTATGNVPMESAAVEVVPVEDVSESVSLWKGPVFRWIVGIAAVGLLLLVGVAIALVLNLRSTEPEPAAPEKVVANNQQKEQEEALKKMQERAEVLKKQVDQLLSENTPRPSGIEICIELGVLYLDQGKTAEAEALFKRMDERRPPSAYHFVGRLGLAVTDALQERHQSSQTKLRELFGFGSKDNRSQILKDHLNKNPRFAEWVNEADPNNIRNGGSGNSRPQWGRGFPGKMPFKR